MKKVKIIGAGLAGSEAALQVSKRGISVDLYEMRPAKQTGAHKTAGFAEFVCSNSLGAYEVINASGLLKHESEILGCELMKTVKQCKVPAGGALAVDRELFSQKITEKIMSNPLINVIRDEVTKIEFDQPVIIASGPLTSDSLSEEVKKFLGEDHLHFFDAVAPIVTKDSINFEKAFYLNRYNKGDADYINCPMNKEEYDKFYDMLITAPRIELKSFEKGASFFESCLPVEVLASRGRDTLRFGPMKPVGLVDVRTGKENYAVVQLRQDNSAASLYNIVGFQTNIKHGSQKELIRMIPGLENADIVRYGVMHRNTFINSPKVLLPTLQSRKNPDIFFAGQITGTEGYTESIVSGLVAGINAARIISGQDPVVFPEETMIGALLHYITYEGHKSFQPVNSNWGILKDMPLDKQTRKNKKLKNELLAKRALEFIKKYENS